MHDKNLKDSKFNEWQDLVKETVKRFPERKRSFTTSSDIDVECLYYTEEKDYHEKLGFPGMYPYTRGIQPTMYRSRLWSMRQYDGFGYANEKNDCFRYLLVQIHNIRIFVIIFISYI